MKKLYLNQGIDLFYLDYVFKKCIIIIDECTDSGLFQIAPDIPLDQANLSA